MINTTEIPERVQVAVERNIIKVRSNDNELQRQFPSRLIEIKTEKNQVIINQKLENYKTKALVGTFLAHIRNMMNGVQKPFVYKLKVCSVHFPMKVTLVGSEFRLENFIGEKKPKTLKINNNVKIEINGEEITVTAINKEEAGQTAAKIEQLTRLRKKDRRVFMDGIFITEKPK